MWGRRPAVELMDVEPQKMSEPELTSQRDADSNQVCGCFQFEDMSESNARRW